MASLLVGGLRERTLYVLQHEIQGPRRKLLERGPERTFETGPANFEVPQLEFLAPPMPQARDTPLLLVSPIPGASAAFTVDLEGRLLWYDPSGGSYGILTRPVVGGTLLFVSLTTLTEADLLGEVVRQATVEDVKAQLDFEILGFHHEASRLPGDRTVVLAYVLREVSPGRHLLGDAIVVLSSDYQVGWVWNAFDHLDVERRATLGEMCNIFAGCPPLPVNAEDWMHSNAVAYSPEDGHLVLSVRNQDWIVKIDYADGEGSGEVLWRLGPEGDFELETNDPDP